MVDVTETVEASATGGRSVRVLAGSVLVVGVLLGLVVAVDAVGQIARPGGAVTVLVAEDRLGLDSVAGVPEGATLGLSGAGGTEVGTSAATAPLTLEVDVLPAWLRGVTQAPALLAAGILVAGTVLLHRVLVEIARGRPFAEANPGRLRGLALLAVASAVLPGTASSFATVVTLEHLGVDGDSPFGFTILDLSLAPFLLAGVLVVVAEVFRHGRRLTDDVEGLV